MEKAKISPGQLLTLIVLFDMGTAILRVLAMSAGKDAWLAILLGTAGGLAIFWVYASLIPFVPGASAHRLHKSDFGKMDRVAFGFVIHSFFHPWSGKRFA